MGSALTLAGFNRLPPQVLAVEFEQIECAEDRCAGPASADQVEYRNKALLVELHVRVIDGPGRREAALRHGNLESRYAAEATAARIIFRFVTIVESSPFDTRVG